MQMQMRRYTSSQVSPWTAQHIAQVLVCSDQSPLRVPVVDNRPAEFVIHLESSVLFAKLSYTNAR